MEIRIVDDFKIKTDENNYKVKEYGVIKYKDNMRYGVKKVTYHGNLEQALRYILKQTIKIGNYDTINDIIKDLESIENKILDNIEKALKVYEKESKLWE